MAKIAELANKLVWKNPDLNVLRSEYTTHYSPLSVALQDHIRRSDARGRLVLPDLGAFGNETVAVFSDYGGETSGDFYIYSVLVCGWNLTGSFTEKMRSVRMAHALGDKEIAFKDFRMGPLRRALPEHLAALNNLLPGFLFTLAADKQITSLFGPQEKSTKQFIAQTLEAHALGTRKPDLAEKLVRIVHIAAFFTALLVHNDQKIFWMTDHDAICANQELHQQTLALFQRVLGL